jgi:hypothetical protein
MNYYSDYISENLSESTTTLLSCSRDVTTSLKYLEYLSGQIDKSISYNEYLSERIDKMYKIRNIRKYKIKSLF